MGAFNVLEDIEDSVNLVVPYSFFFNEMIDKSWFQILRDNYEGIY